MAAAESAGGQLGKQPENLLTVVAAVLPDQELVDLLKHPLSVGGARRILLNQLESRLGKRLASHWDVCRLVADPSRPALNLTSLPQRQTRVPFLLALDAPGSLTRQRTEPEPGGARRLAVPDFRRTPTKNLARELPPDDPP